jgi:all-trans-retinol 13,14-reductase
MKYDVIVIGSGFGGLACAQLLSKKGYHVLVLESHWQPGGCMQSYQRKGHAFDTGLHYVGGLEDGESLHDIFEQLGLLRLPWYRLDVDGVIAKIMTTDYVKEELEGRPHLVEA